MVRSFTSGYEYPTSGKFAAVTCVCGKPGALHLPKLEAPGEKVDAFCINQACQFFVTDMYGREVQHVHTEQPCMRVNMRMVPLMPPHYLRQAITSPLAGPGSLRDPTSFNRAFPNPILGFQGARLQAQPVSRPSVSLLPRVEVPARLPGLPVGIPLGAGRPFGTVGIDLGRSNSGRVRSATISAPIHPDYLPLTTPVTTSVTTPDVKPKITRGKHWVEPIILSSDDEEVSSIKVEKDSSQGSGHWTDSFNDKSDKSEHDSEHASEHAQASAIGETPGLVIAESFTCDSEGNPLSGPPSPSSGKSMGAGVSSGPTTVSRSPVQSTSSDDLQDLLEGYSDTTVIMPLIDFTLEANSRVITSRPREIRDMYHPHFIRYVVQKSRV